MEESSHAPDRRTSLLEAAFDVIAHEGFEGLRTRRVAEKAGVNIATLHYYFPKKSVLIWSLSEYIGLQFLSIHAPPVPSSGKPGLDRLRQEFADYAFYNEHHPDLMTVMEELVLRAKRDQAVREVVDKMRWYWRQGLAEIARMGIADGSFCSDLDLNQVTEMLVTIFVGLGATRPANADAIRESVENWLVKPQEREN